MGKWRSNDKTILHRGFRLNPKGSCNDTPRARIEAALRASPRRSKIRFAPANRFRQEHLKVRPRTAHGRLLITNVQVRREPFPDHESNVCLRRRLTEYHTGYRAFSRAILLQLPLEELPDGSVLDNQILVQLVAFGYEISEMTCPAKYFKEASSGTYTDGGPTRSTAIGTRCTRGSSVS